MPNQHLLRRGRYSQINGIYHITSTTVNRYRTSTGHRLAMTACRCCTSPALNKTSELLCWVLMPDHVHWLLKLGEGDSVSAWVQRMKAVSAREVNRSEEHTSELQSRENLVCRLLLENKKFMKRNSIQMTLQGTWQF